jgi:periplasmic divalent cation tolerance protein
MSRYRSLEDAESDHQGDCTMADEQLSVILVTAPSLEVANQLAQGLVTERLAACVTVLPQVMSTYVWEGQLTQTEEVLMMIKTRRSRYAALEQFVRVHHPHDTPEIVEILAGHVTQRYWEWVLKETTHG